MFRIAILLACYNGAKFIEEQIESIICSKPKGSVLTFYISDDNSTDNTVEVVKEIKAPLDIEIQIESNRLECSGHVGNFANTCTMALKEEHDLYFFADQDDVWESNKLSLMSDQVTKLSQLHPDMPVLVHSDLFVVDENGKLLSNSFVKYQGLPCPNRHSHISFLYQNVATGCTFAFNRQLLIKATPIPDTVLVHDWWFALVARYCGIIEFIEQPLVNYRQHSSNAIGAIKGEELTNFLNPKFIKILLNYPRHIAQAIEQAKTLRAISGISLEDSDNYMFETFAELKSYSIWRRIDSLVSIVANDTNIKTKIYIALTAVLLPYLKVKNG